MDKHEEINRHLAALNATWQRYVRAIELQLDTVPMAALNRDFIAVQEDLATSSITESMLVYDSVTMTFSLPVDGEAD